MNADESTKPSAINFNSVMLAIVLGVLSWNGYTTYQTSIAVAVAAERGRTQDRDLLDLRARVSYCEVEIAKLRH